MDKVTDVSLLFKNKMIGVIPRSLNLLEVIPTVSELGLDDSKPSLIVVQDDLQLYPFDVFTPDSTVNSSSDSSSSDDEITENINSILSPNYKYWENYENGLTFLVLASKTRFTISHIIIKTPRFTACQLKSVVFFASDVDPNLTMKTEEDEDLSRIYDSVTKKVIWPPKRGNPQSKPFAFITMPENEFYIEYKLPTRVRGKYIKAICLDGWVRNIEQPNNIFSTFFDIRPHAKISIQFMGFIGPVEMSCDIGSKFGIKH